MGTSYLLFDSRFFLRPDRVTVSVIVVSPILELENQCRDQIGPTIHQFEPKFGPETVNSHELLTQGIRSRN